MYSRYRNLSVALLVALVSLGLFVVAVGAATKTPPYVVAIASTGENSRPSRVGVDPVGGRGYVLDNANLLVFSGTQKLDDESVSVGSPEDIAVDPGRYVYVTSAVQGNPVTVLDVQSGVKSTVNMGTPSKASGAVVVLTTTHYAYVTLPDNSTVAVLSGTKVIAEAISVGTDAEPVAVAADPTTGYVYVVNRHYGIENGTVSVIQGTSVIRTLDVGMNPIAVDVNPKTGLVYVVNSGSDTLTIIDSSDFSTSTVTVDEEPNAVAVNPTLNQIYVTNNEGNSLSVLQDVVFSKTIPLGDAPQAVDVNPVTGYIYVVGGTDISGTITVLSSSLASETYVPVGHSPQDVGVLPLEDGDWAYAAMYKGTGGDEGGRIVILGRTEAARVVVPDKDDSGAVPAEVTCQGSGGPVEIEVSPQDVDGAVDLICTAWEPDTEPRYVFADQGFLLKTYLKGEHQPGFTFDPPLTATVTYPTPPPEDAEEGELELRVGVPDREWGTDGVVVLSPPDQGSLQVSLSSLPDDALAGYAVVVPRTLVYLPLVMRN